MHCSAVLHAAPMYTNRLWPTRVRHRALRCCIDVFLATLWPCSVFTNGMAHMSSLSCRAEQAQMSHSKWPKSPKASQMIETNVWQPDFEGQASHCRDISTCCLHACLVLGCFSCSCFGCGRTGWDIQRTSFASGPGTRKASLSNPAVCSAELSCWCTCPPVGITVTVCESQLLAEARAARHSRTPSLARQLRRPFSLSSDVRKVHVLLQAGWGRVRRGWLSAASWPHMTKPLQSFEQAQDAVRFTRMPEALHRSFATCRLRLRC